MEPATKVAGLAKKRPSATNCRRKALAALQVMIRDPEPALRLIADATQLLDELQEALPELVPEVWLEARALIHRLEERLRILITRAGQPGGSAFVTGPAACNS